MNRSARRGAAAMTLVAVLGVVLLLMVGAWAARGLLTRLFPIRHEGQVMRIAQFHKGGFNQRDQGTRQINQFAIVFTDGFQCEGSDTCCVPPPPDPRRCTSADTLVQQPWRSPRQVTEPRVTTR